MPPLPLRLRAIVTALLGLLIASPANPQLLDPALRGHGGPVRALSLDADGTLASAGLDGVVILWNTRENTARKNVRFHTTSVNALVAVAAGCFVSGGEDGRLGTWCERDANPVELPSGHTGPLSALAVSADGKTLFSGSWDRTVRALPLALSAPGPTPSPEPRPLPDRARIVADHAAPVTAIALSHDGGSLLSASFDGEVRLTSIASGAQIARRKFPASANGIAATRSGHFLLAGADGVLREVTDRLEPVGETTLPDGPLTSVAVSPDGSTIATAGMRTPVTLLDRASGGVKSRILGPGLPVWALVFSKDGATLFTGGADRAVRRFDAATGQPAGMAIAPPGRTELPEPRDPGAAVFRACSACHGLSASDNNLAGPTLAGIMGRRIASAPGYVYSDAFKSMDIIWTPESISRLFEVGPAIYTPGTKMPEQRIVDPGDRRALVEWLTRVTGP